MEKSKDTEDGDDSINEKLTKVKDQYENLAEKTKERNGKIAEVVPLSKKFYEDAEKLRTWLEETESDVTKLDNNKPLELQDVLDDVDHAKVSGKSIVLSSRKGKVRIGFGGKKHICKRYLHSSCGTW